MATAVDVGKRLLQWRQERTRLVRQLNTAHVRRLSPEAVDGLRKDIAECEARIQELGGAS
jgi:predicted rRNA methylase YqxC with S4 and FtsJ domains